MNNWKLRSIALLSLCFSISVNAQFDPFPPNTVDCGFICSPDCDDSGGGDDDDPLCELLGTCGPGDCDPTIQSCIGDDDGGGDDGCEGADCGDNDSCNAGGIADGGANAPNGSTGNPINLISGNKYKRQIDLAPLPGVLGLQFIRHYNSAYSKSIGLGRGWRHSYSTILSVNKGFQPGEMDIIKIQQADGRILRFERTGERKVGAQYRTRNFDDGYITTTDFGYQWRWRSDRVVSFDVRGLMTQVEQHGQVLKLRYGGSSAQLISVVDPQGRRLQLHYDNNRLAAFTDPKGQTTAFKFDKQERLVNVVRDDRRIRLYHYQDDIHIWNLTGITDERGIRVQSYGYDKQGRAISSTKDTNTEKVSVEYDDENQRRILTDSGGIKTIYTLTEVSGQTMIADVRGPGCSVCQGGDLSYEYNDALQVTKITRKSGVVTEFEYDKRGRLLAHFTRPTNGQRQLIASYKYSVGSSQPSSIQRPSIAPGKLHVTDLSYTKNGQLSMLSESGFAPATPINSIDFDPLSQSYVALAKRQSKLEYDDNGRLIKIDGPREGVEDVLKLSYTNVGYLDSITLPSGIVKKAMEHDALGRPTKLQTGTQVPVELSYTKSGQVAKVKRGSALVSYLYDEVGNLLSITDPNGKRVEMSYDAANRMQGISRDNGPSLEFSFNDESRVSAQTLLGSDGGVLKTVSYFYDAEARLNEQIGESQAVTGANRKLYSYDEQGQLAELHDNDRSVAQFRSSGLGQLMQISQPGGINTVLHKNTDGEVVGVTDANGNSTIRQLDDYGRTVILHSLDAGINYFQYDQAGNLVTRQNVSSGTFTREYDAANRLLKHIDKEGEREYSYDPLSGKLASLESSASSDHFQYDQLARLSEHTRLIDGFKFSTTYAYNDYDQLVRKTLPDNRVLKYQYYLDGARKGELRGITTDALWGFGERALLEQIDSNRWDGQSSINYGNGLSTIYRYNSGGNIESISTDDAFSFNYDYDASGNIIGIKGDSTNSQFSYDERNRLKGATVGQAQYSYRYDKVGNRVQAATNDEIQTLTYGKFASGNRVQQIGLKSVSYNAQGSPLQMPSIKGQRRYEYSAQQRPLKLFVDGSLRAEYAYNGFGERIKKTTYKTDEKGTTSETRYYLYDGRELSAEVGGDGEVKASYIYHQGRPVVKIDGSDIYYLHTDHLGTPRLVTNENKKIVWKASYSPFGKANIEIQQVSLNLRFPGQYEDQESGTHYNYFRDYDPQLGRYLSSDPIGLRAGINTYAYSHSNPIMASDSLGLFTRPSNQQQSDELIQRLSNFTEQQISDYVNSELSSFDDRQHFYRWAHDQLTTKPGATRTDWFLAASQVNEFDSLGGVGFGWGGLDPFSSETEDFLVTAGLSLANHNIGTFVTMIGGGSVFNLCFLNQESQDLQLVVYEQEELARITTEYFTNNPTLDQNEIMTDINDVFNHIGFGGLTGQVFGDRDTQRVIDKHFHDKDPPELFDINNIQHRIILGQGLVRINAGTFEP